MTEKYLDYYNISNSYVDEVVNRIKKRFDGKELELLEEVLKITAVDLMPELNEIENIKV